MKVGMLTSSVSRNNGGIYEVLRSLSKSLQARPECDVALFGLHDSFSDIDSASWYGLTPKVCNTKGPSAFGYAPLLYDALVNANLDLIHLHGIWMYPSVVCNKWSRKTSKPYIISPHGMLDRWALHNSRFKKKISKILYEDRNLKGAACIHAGSVSEYEAIREIGLNNPVCILPNGVFIPDGISNPTHAPWNGPLTSNTKTLLFLGRLHPKKGLDNLLRAWDVVTGNNCLSTDWQLVIAGVGSSEYEKDLKKLVTKLSLSSSVHFIGPQYQEAKTACYSSASAFILPSFSEGMPMAVLDAWSFGLPVLMTPQCNLPIGFEKQAAIEMEPKIESIIKGLNLLFSIPEQERLDLGRRGKSLASEQFSWRIITSQLLSVYAWVLGEGDKPECVIVD